MKPAMRRASSSSVISSRKRRPGTSRVISSPVRTAASGPPRSGFRRNMQHDGAEAGAAHAGVRDSHHILHAGLQQFLRHRNLSPFRETRSALGAAALHHQHGGGVDGKVVAVDLLAHLIAIFEHIGAPAMRAAAQVSRRSA